MLFTTGEESFIRKESLSPLVKHFHLFYYLDLKLSDQLFRDTADRMAEDGYLEAGYEYLIIDDCWLANERDSDGRLQPNADRFPNAIKDLADYVIIESSF